MFRYIVSELKNSRRFCFLFVLNLSLGLTGFIAIDGFKVSLDRTIKLRSKSVLGADFGLSARRPIRESERNEIKKQVGQNHEESRMIEMFSMVANRDKRSRLIQIKAIQANYPFYGNIDLENSGQVDLGTHKELTAEQKVWVYPEVLQQLKVNIGDQLIVGETEFTIADVVKNDSAAGFSTNMAPRIYMNLNHLDATKLLRPGSIAWHSYVYKLPGKNSKELDSLRDLVFEKIDNPDLQVYTHENVSEQLARLLSQLNDFLGLASLVALFLAAVGTGFLFRAYFRSKVKQIAILISLGSTHLSAFALYLTQILILGLMSAVLAIVMSFILVPGIGAITQNLLPFPVQFTIQLSTVLLGLCIGTIGSFLICLPILVDLRKLKPSLLLVDKQSDRKRFSPEVILAFIPGLLVFWGLSAWLSNSFQIGTVFTAVFLGSGLILGAASWLFFSGFNWLRVKSQLSLFWAVRDLGRNRLTALAGFMAIGLGMLLLNLIPQLQSSLDAELASPEQSKVPSLFMFDIQEEQLDRFKKIINEERVQVSQLSPMIRARLTKVNNEDFDKGMGKAVKHLSREEQREMRFRNRGFNLSYRDRFIDSERLVKGRLFSGIYQEGSSQLPEISLEQRFARRLGLSIGDTMTFEIESVPITGEVVNLRAVRWASFQPNFFIQFQPGVLELAPKIFIATLSSLSMEKKYQIQDRIVSQLPNVSLIDVSRLVDRLSRIMEQMAWALRFMAFLCLIAGFVVVYSIANHQASSRKWDIGLLKALGADFRSIRGQFLWQYGIISLLSGLMGAMISLAVSYLISGILFESLWAFDLKTPIVSVILCVLVTLIITHLAIASSLKRNTRDLFSSFV